MKSLLRYLAAAAIVGPGLPVLLAQNLDLPYSSGSSGADGPFTVPAFAQPAFGGCMTFDPVRQECVYFGGAQFSAGVFTWLNATWTWNGQAWSLKNPAVKPPARSGAGMAFDPVRGEVVLFGGWSGSVYLGDTWTWNGSAWTQKSPATSPSPREGGPMVWDAAREEIVLAGGYTASGPSNETWTWNGTDWLLKTPATPPPTGNSPGMAYDEVTQQVVLVVFSNPPQTAVWVWNGVTWTNRTPATNPAWREGANFVYSPAEQKCLLFAGRNSGNTVLDEVWVWDGPGGTWTAKSWPRMPAARFGAVAAWDSVRQEVVISHGTNSNYTASNADTWSLKDGHWLAKAGARYTFDLRAKAEAIWNFTTITVPAGTTVEFVRNTGNHPVLWLASGDVTINGTVDASGAGGGFGPGFAPAGGPGGYDGGKAADSSTPPTAGQGPGGGRAQGISGWTNLHGETGKHAVSLVSSTYGTPFAQPLIGGSGGGGGAAGVAAAGQGGGGGGAIAIASTRDIFIGGSILAKGGQGARPGIGGNGQPGAGVGGSGSGGVIRLVADRVIAPSGTVDASGGPNLWSDPGESGRVRLEGYIRQTNPTLLRGVVSQSVPVAGSILTQAGGRLHFAKVSGQNVANPPRGDLMNPDVIFTATGEVEIEVHALNVPDGTPVTVTINHSTAGVINLPAAGTVTLQQCKATFTATIPAGSGVLQGFATYNVGGPPPAP